MGWSESERGCKKHQYAPHEMMMKTQTKAIPSQGVCSFCLSERLSQLYAPSSTIYSLSNHTLIQPFGFSSSSPDRHSNSSSAPDSPTVQTHQRPRPPHHRTASEVNAKGSISFMIRSRTASTATSVGGDRGGSYDVHGGVMKKSRSVAVVSKGSTTHIHHFGDHLGKMSGGGKKKRGFWSKLLRTKDVFKHSKTGLR